MAAPDLREKAKTFPTRPGVYWWKDASGGVLYVGKAGSLRHRVLQYFGPQEDERKSTMMTRVADVEFVAVDTEKEALILEQTLIKRHRPPFNVMLVDDRKYPYIAVLEEEWPRIVYTRNLELSGDFFGPFPDAGKARRVARMMNQTFRLRQCRVLPKRECLYYHMNQCSAPCIQAVTPEAYRDQVRTARDFLKGRTRELGDRIRREMQQAAEERRFERAAELRDLAAAVDSVLERQRVSSNQAMDYDAVGLAHREFRWCAAVLWIRGGAVVGRDAYFLNAPEGSTTPQVLEAFLEQLYVKAPGAPRELLVPASLRNRAGLESALQEIHAHPVRIGVPERGDRRRSVELAETNAAELLDQERLLRERRGGQAVEALQAALDLAEAPNHIECFDVSHHSGQHTVASLVVLKEGRAWKPGYRRFRIRTTGGGDDPGAMREAVLRRYARVLAEEGADALPDLVIVDGGPTQLNAALSALKELGLEAMPLIGLAKKREEIFRPHRLHPLALDPASPALHLVQRARDEAHRFAVGYQGLLKRKGFIESGLDGIPGVGPERRRRLLTTFGSLEGVAAASPEELAAVPGIPGPLAQRIHDALRPRKASSPNGD